MDMKINKKNIIFVVISVILISIITSVLTLVIYNKLNNKDYYNDNILKVVEVSSYDEEINKSYGSAWFIDDNTLVTNYHVISYLNSGERIIYDNIKIRFYDMADYESVSIISFSKDEDIAFLTYSGNHKHSYFKYIYDYNVKDRVYNIGNYNNYGLSYKEGYISLSGINFTYNDISQEFIQVDISVGEGDSGSIVFNKNSKVIGMITFRGKNNSNAVEQNFAYVIPIKRIVELYKKL